MVRILLVISFIAVSAAQAQTRSSMVFQHLNTSNGLSYIGVNDMCTDARGYLWISTGNGLNMFNGKTVEKYFATAYPQMQNSNVIHVTCDGSDRIWFITAGGNVTLLDEKRQFHRVAIYQDKQFIKTRWILNNGPNIILFTENGFYKFRNIAKHEDSISVTGFEKLNITAADSILSKRFRQVFGYDDENYFFIRDDGFYRLNFSERKVYPKTNIPNFNALIKWKEGFLLGSNVQTKETELVNLKTGEISFPFKNLKDQFGKPVSGYFVFGGRLEGPKYLFTTAHDGIYIFDSSRNSIFNYHHLATDPTSIANNANSTIAVGKKGWVFVTCNPNGISYFNSEDFVQNQWVFTDNKGKSYDGYIAAIATNDNNRYLIGTGEGVLEWKRNENTVTFLEYRDDAGGLLPKKEEVITIIFDEKERAWITTWTQGILVVDKNNKLVKHISNEPGKKGALKMHLTAHLVKGPDGFIWVTGNNGVARINPQTFEVDNFAGQPLQRFDTLSCNALVFPDNENLWFGTTRGVYNYNLKTKTIKEYNQQNGLVDNWVFTINADRNKNIYVGTRLGLNILFPNGRIKTIRQKDGLLIDRAEGLVLDRHNRMWIGNDIGLACYDPKDSSLVTFDERYGLSIYGFRVNSYFQTPNGEFAFGTPRGMQSFDPDLLYNKRISLNAQISRIESKNTNAAITGDTTFSLPSTSNQVAFYFNTVDFSPHVRTFYQYQLEGMDKDWTTVSDVNFVRYSYLPAGKYRFKLRISNDNKNWQLADNTVNIEIALPFYKTWWFKLLGSLLAIGVLLLVLNYYRRKQNDKRAELETQLVISYFASQINDQKNEEELLWDVARNCISQLNFEDCVIYLIDEKRQVLVQKAAYGPKSPVDFTIHQPIEIPMGKGIVGGVAESGKPEVINNTELDSRYIVDDERRFSEIAVPIIINNRVIGVIDSEHPQKGFFTKRHLQILSTIAVLCASQLQKIHAEEEKQRATIELLQNKQKATESRLQSLRLQMNPHFLFNALNSIQQMILANEDIVATKYLSKFSKLLRAILVYSDRDSITLKEEVDILSLYIELESIRFKGRFQYEIEVHENIEADEVKIPALLIQPFVENAIWHGLMHKEGDRSLHVKFYEEKDFIKCVVEDNGIGRKKAKQMELISPEKKHTGKGIEVSRERLKTLRNNEAKQGTISIIDVVQDEESKGTRVEIMIPVQN